MATQRATGTDLDGRIDRIVYLDWSWLAWSPHGGLHRQREEGRWGRRWELSATTSTAIHATAGTRWASASIISVCHYYTCSKK